MNHLKQFVLIAAIAVLTVGCGAKTPLEEAQAAAEQLDLKRQADDVINGAFAQAVPCGRVARTAFDPATGNARVWVARKADSTLECYNSAGFHRITRARLTPITSTEVAEIIENPKCYPPPVVGCGSACGQSSPASVSVPPPPPPAAPVYSTPLPELGTGPCCGRS